MASDTRRIRTRALVPASNWWKRTSSDFVADTSRTGTVTSPKLIDPVQMACGTCLLLPERRCSRRGSRGPTTFAGRGPAVQGNPSGNVQSGKSSPTEVRGRRPTPAPDQSRQGVVPRHGLHQRRRDPLLQRDRAGDAPPPARPPGHDAAPPRRRDRRAVLREALPEAPPRLAAHRAARRRLRDRRLLDRRARRAGVDREPRGAGAAHAPGAGRGSVAADRDRVRPRPGAGDRSRRLRAGRAGAARAARRSWSSTRW